MGLSYLRRGCSLEVIYEEDSDFCSHLDSLESTGVKFGLKESDNFSVDSLSDDKSSVFRTCAEAEIAFRSLDQILDERLRYGCPMMDSCYVEWEEFSPEEHNMKRTLNNQKKIYDYNSLGSRTPLGNKPPMSCANANTMIDRDVEIPTSGRRSRISRRQIVEANWTEDSADISVTSTGTDSAHISFSSSGSSPSETGASSVTSIQSDCSSKTLDSSLQELGIDEMEKNTPSAQLAGSSLSCSPHIGKIGRICTVKVEINSKAEYCEESCTPSPSSSIDTIKDSTPVFDFSNKDSLDSYISTMTDETETAAYAFADPYEDVTSVSSSTFDSSSSSETSSNGSVCTTLNAMPHWVFSAQMDNVSGTKALEKNRIINDQSKENTRQVEKISKSGSNVTTQLTVNNVANPSAKRIASSTIGEDLKENHEPGLLKFPTKNELSVSAAHKDDSCPNPCKINEKDSCSKTGEQSSLGESSEICTDVKKVRALFEPIKDNCTKTAITNNIIYSVNKTIVPSNKRYFEKNSKEPSLEPGKNNKSHSISFDEHKKKLNIDFQDLLVNENVVIEESPDIYQVAKAKIREKLSRDEGLSTLRRCKSLSAGIHSLGRGGEDKGSEKHHSDHDHTSRVAHIAADEMPPRDTVKNACNVFERLLSQTRQWNAHSLVSSTEPCSYGKNKQTSLWCVKSNPSSKIFRSESMKDDFTTMTNTLKPTRLVHNSQCRPYGKPILMPDDTPFIITPKTARPRETSESSDGSSEIQFSDLPHKTQEKDTLKKQNSEPPAKFNLKINEMLSSNGKLSVCKSISLSGEDLSSLMSSLTDDDIDGQDIKIVSSDVLQRIRSCGTTTTYFGGQIVAKTVRNKNLAVNATCTPSSSPSMSPTLENNTSPGVRNVGEDCIDGLCSSSSTSPTEFQTPIAQSPVSCSTSLTNNSSYITCASDDDNPGDLSPDKQSKCGIYNVATAIQTNASFSTHDLPLYSRHIFPQLRGFESIFSAGMADTTPRIISVVPKSNSSSSGKCSSSNSSRNSGGSSPTASVISEGRNSPEGCESLNKTSNEDDILKLKDTQDGNNNSIISTNIHPKHMHECASRNQASELTKSQDGGAFDGKTSNWI